MPFPVTVHHGACETFDFPRTHFLPPFPCLRLAHLLTTVSPHAAQPRVKQAWSATEAVQFCGLPPWGPGCARLRVQPCGYGGMCRRGSCTPDVWLDLFHHMLGRCCAYPPPCSCCCRLVPPHAVSLSHLSSPIMSPMPLLLPTCSITSFTCCVVVAPILSHAVAVARLVPSQAVSLLHPSSPMRLLLRQCLPLNTTCTRWQITMETAPTTDTTLQRHNTP